LDSVFDFARPADLELSIYGMPYSELDPADSTGDSLYMINRSTLATKERTPSDIVVCIDKSGSMGMAASAPGVEDSGLNMLDIVKHAVKTIGAVLGPSDRLSIVAWSSGSQVVTELTSMNSQGQRVSKTKLEAIQEGGMTNIWDGLKTGLEILEKRDTAIVGGLPANTRSAAIFILTDGSPNVEPPRGYIPTMQRYKDQHGGSYPGVINTFGFGYESVAKLLADYAQEGGGVFAFIPDSGFVGTIFVNALANCLTTVVESCIATVMCDKAGCTLKSLSSGDVQAEFEDGITFVSKTVQNGQDYGHVVRVSGGSSTPNPADISAKIKYRHVGANRESDLDTITACGNAEATTAQKHEIACESFRYMAIDAIKWALQTHPKTGNEDCPEAGDKMRSVIALMKGWLARNSKVPAVNLSGEHGDAKASAVERITDLLTDVEGQCLEAVSTFGYYTKWGENYLYSISRAHELKQCNNFKDPGVQHYGNRLFTELRDLADDTFSSLPPPVPSPSPYANTYGNSGTSSYSQYSAPVNMADFNRSGGVCFHEDAMVHLNNGRKKRAAEVQAGDVLEGGVGIVKCVVKTIVRGGRCELVRLDSTSGSGASASGTLRLTAWHPVKIAGKWHFPALIGTVEEVACEAVYSYLVESANNNSSTNSVGRYATQVVVEGVECATLAHGIENDDTVSHPFFGTTAVVDALAACSGWELGTVTFTSGDLPQDRFMQVDTASSMVVGFDASLSLAV
jgi:hypothetical protein